MLKLSPELLSIVADSKVSKSPRGISCYFVRINDYWGIKVYRSKAERDGAVEQQTKIYNLGYAPKVGSSFEVGCSYCYVTEIAETTLDTVNTDRSWREREREVIVKYPNLDIDIALLCEQLQPFMDVSDCHYGNVGYLNGFLVWIDFGF